MLCDETRRVARAKAASFSLADFSFLLIRLCAGHAYVPQRSCSLRRLRRCRSSETNGVKWAFHTQGEVVSSPAIVGGIVYVAVMMASYTRLTSRPARKVGISPPERASLRHLPSPMASSISAATTAISTPWMLATGKLRWKFRNAGERRYAATHLHGSLPAGETMPDPFDVYLSSPAFSNGAVYFGSGDGNIYALDAASGTSNGSFKTGDVVHASPAIVDGKLYIGSWDSYFYALDAATGKLSSGDSRPAKIPTFTTRSASSLPPLWRWHRLLRLPRFKPLRAGRCDRQKTMVLQQQRILGYRFTCRAGGQSLLRHIRHGAAARGGREDRRTHRFAQITTGRSSLRPRSPATRSTSLDRMANWSPSISSSFKSAWTFQTEGSRQNLAALSKTDGKPNYEAAFASNFYDDMLVGIGKMHTVGTILSSPVISGNVVYVGSADGSLYALQ